MGLSQGQVTDMAWGATGADPVTLQSEWRQLYLPQASELKGLTVVGLCQCEVVTAAPPSSLYLFIAGFTFLPEPFNSIHRLESGREA